MNSLFSRPALSEPEALARARQVAAQNERMTSLIGQGYYGTVLPPVIQRNILENPAWYTAYTPYQPEISQGRLEALLNFQTLVADLTGLEIANASLLDEATAAAEAMAMAQRISQIPIARRFSPTRIAIRRLSAVLAVRAEALGWHVRIGDPMRDLDAAKVFGAIFQYPGTFGDIRDLREPIAQLKAANAISVVAADPLALTILKPPGELGADIAVGSMQRFGVPMGYGGPHAAYIATRDAHKRALPGRLVGVSIDSRGNRAYRLALQTREQHIRREKATSNICTAQVLLAVIASMYAVYHGPEGLTAIARRVSQDGSRPARRSCGALGCDGAVPRHSSIRLPSTLARRREEILERCPRWQASIFATFRRITAVMHRHQCAMKRPHPPLLKPSGARSAIRREAAARRSVELAGARQTHIPNDLRGTSAFLSHPGVPPVSLGNRIAALHAPARGPRPCARPQHDPARILHDEAQRDGRNDAADLARIRRSASVRAGVAGARLCRR